MIPWPRNTLERRSKRIGKSGRYERGTVTEVVYKDTLVITWDAGDKQVITRGQLRKNQANAADVARMLKDFKHLAGTSPSEVAKAWAEHKKK